MSAAVIILVLADISDLHVLGDAQRRHADDLGAVAADLAAARMSTDAFGTVGADFVAALNAALSREAHHTSQIADRLAAARSTSVTIANAYGEADTSAGQAISTHRR